MPAGPTGVQPEAAARVDHKFGRVGRRLVSRPGRQDNLVDGVRPHPELDGEGIVAPQRRKCPGPEAQRAGGVSQRQGPIRAVRRGGRLNAHGEGPPLRDPVRSAPRRVAPRTPHEHGIVPPPPLLPVRQPDAEHEFVGPSQRGGGPDVDATAGRVGPDIQGHRVGAVPKQAHPVEPPRRGEVEAQRGGRAGRVEGGEQMHGAARLPDGDLRASLRPPVERGQGHQSQDHQSQEEAAPPPQRPTAAHPRAGTRSPRKRAAVVHRRIQ
jgi:hypothetical protein